MFIIPAVVAGMDGKQAETIGLCCSAGVDVRLDKIVGKPGSEYAWYRHNQRQCSPRAVGGRAIEVLRHRRSPKEEYLSHGEGGGGNRKGGGRAGRSGDPVIEEEEEKERPQGRRRRNGRCQGRPIFKKEKEEEIEHMIIGNQAYT